jgi:phosphate starvation-inducible PhoH-like protein
MEVKKNSNNHRVTKRLSMQGIDQLQLLGYRDSNLRTIEKNFDAHIVVRGGDIILQGTPEVVEQLERVFSELILMVNRNQVVEPRDVDTVVELVKVQSQNGGEEAKATMPDETDEGVILYKKNGFIKPKSKGQLEYYRATQKNDIVFVIGPAGTGKTYLAVAMAVAAFRDREVDRIILARPAVEAGESLGFLPGDLREKVEPYLRPLYDALYDMIPADKLRKYIETNIIEIVPLAYMRGRTLNNAFVILDEAQNTSTKQMKMFLTRLGVNSRAIITGDVTQIDLPSTSESGLVQIREVLQGIEGIAFVHLTDRDVVRHRLVREIIKAYDAYDELQRGDKA